MSAASRRGFLAAAGAAGATALAPLGAATAAAGAPEVPLLETYVAGLGRYCAGTAFARIETGMQVSLRREPENGYDARAVAVWTEAGDKLGFLPRIHNQAVANLMDAGLRPVARVRRVSLDGGPREVRLDVRLAIAR